MKTLVISLLRECSTEELDALTGIFLKAPNVFPLLYLIAEKQRRIFENV